MMRALINFLFLFVSIQYQVAVAQNASVEFLGTDETPAAFVPYTPRLNGVLQPTPASIEYGTDFRGLTDVASERTRTFRITNLALASRNFTLFIDSTAFTIRPEDVTLAARESATIEVTALRTSDTEIATIQLIAGEPQNRFSFDVRSEPLRIEASILNANGSEHSEEAVPNTESGTLLKMVQKETSLTSTLQVRNDSNIATTFFSSPPYPFTGSASRFTERLEPGEVGNLTIAVSDDADTVLGGGTSNLRAFTIHAGDSNTDPVAFSGNLRLDVASIELPTVRQRALFGNNTSPIPEDGIVSFGSTQIRRLGFFSTFELTTDSTTEETQITGIRSTDPSFTTEGVPASISNSNPGTFTVRFAPATRGFKSGDILIESPQFGEKLLFTASGDATAADIEIDIDPDSFNFEIAVGEERELSIEIENSDTATANLEVTGFELRDSADNLISTLEVSDFPNSLQPGESAPFSFFYLSRSANTGISSITLRVTSNAVEAIEDATFIFNESPNSLIASVKEIRNESGMLIFTIPSIGDSAGTTWRLASSINLTRWARGSDDFAVSATDDTEIQIELPDPGNTPKTFYRLELLALPDQE